MPGSYRERTVAPGVALWASGGSGATTILPDGCLDLIWDGTRLVVAGPDTRARRHQGGGADVVGLRFAHGLGPAVLGVPADAVRDHVVALDALWSDREARLLTDRVADDPAGVLADLVRRIRRPPDPLGPRVFAAAGAGVGVADIADRCGITVRTLHRRCLPVFGYGPQHLARVLRLQRALAGARGGRGWAELAADEGYADQAHLAREVRALTATTPTALLAELRAR